MIEATANTPSAASRQPVPGRNRQITKKGTSAIRATVRTLAMFHGLTTRRSSLVMDRP